MLLFSGGRSLYLAGGSIDIVIRNTVYGVIYSSIVGLGIGIYLIKSANKQKEM